MAIRAAAGSSAQKDPAAVAPVLVAVAPEGDRQAALRRRLCWRMGLAGALLLLLVGALMVLDYLNPPEDATASSPQYTEPVPVRKALPPLPPARALDETPPVVPVLAGPQASGAALDRSLRPAEALPTDSSAEQAAVGDDAPPVAGPPAAVAPRLLAGPSLQSALLTDRRRAEELQARLAEEGIPSSLQTRLQVGPFKTRADAETAQRKMKALGIDGFSLLARGSRP